MREQTADILAAQWARLGAMFCVQTADQTPDVERLSLDTVCIAPAKSALFTMAATWLVRYAKLVDADHLTALIADELEPQHRPTMGLLLEWAQSAVGNDSFADAIAACGAAVDYRPLFDVHRRYPNFAKLAEAQASPLSKKWGRWMTPIEFKFDALRPERWVLEQNPGLRSRGLTPIPARSSR
jgi:hypothetical protein